MPVSGYPSYILVPRDKDVRLWDAHEVGPNVALASMGTTATSSDEKHAVFDAEHPPEGAIDGRTNREWGNLLGWVNAEPDKSPDWLILEFPFERTIRRVNVYSHSQNSGCPSIKDHELFYEKDGKWVSAGRHDQYQFLFAFTHELPDIRTKRLKIVVHEVMVWAGKWTQLYEVEAYGPWGEDLGMDLLPEWTHHDLFVAGEEREVTVRLKSYQPKRSSGKVQLSLPDGGQVLGAATQSFDIETDATVDLRFTIRPQPAAEGPYRIEARLTSDGSGFPGLTGHRTVTVKNEAPAEWLPEIKVEDPQPDPGDLLLQPNAQNRWTRGVLSNAGTAEGNRLELTFVEPPRNYTRPTPGARASALYDGNRETAWALKGRTFDRYLDALARKEGEAQTAGGTDIDLKGGDGPGDPDEAGIGDPDDMDRIVSGETQALEWSLREEMEVTYVRTQFAEGLKGSYELHLSGAAGPGETGWSKVAAGKIDVPLLIAELKRPIRCRGSKIVLAGLKLPPRAKAAGWRPVIDQIVSAPRIAICDLGAERTIGEVVTEFAADVCCEYDLFATSEEKPEGGLSHPSWRRISPLRRGSGRSVAVLDPPVKARHLATRVVVVEPVGGLWRGGSFERTAVDGFGRPVHPVGVPAGLDGARLEREEAFSGRQSIRIPRGGTLAHKPMPYRNIFAGGIHLGPDGRAERHLLTFYAKGAPLVWTAKLSFRQQAKVEPVGEHRYRIPGSEGWRYHRILIDSISGKMNSMHLEAALDKETADSGSGGEALIDDVLLVAGPSAPVPPSLAFEQHALSPSQFHSEGELLSHPFEIGSLPKALELRWDGEVPERTGITVQFRTGNETGSGKLQWGEWSKSLPVGVKAELSGAEEPFGQVRAKLTTTAPRRTPSLRSLHLTYKGSSVPLGTLYKGGPSPKIQQLRENLKQYSDLRRESAWAQFEIGRLYSVLGHPEQAALEYARVVNEYGDLPPWAATARYETGELFRTAGEHDRARKAYADCIEKFRKLDNCVYPVLRSKAAIRWIEERRE